MINVLLINKDVTDPGELLTVAQKVESHRKITFTKELKKSIYYPCKNVVLITNLIINVL